MSRAEEASARYLLLRASLLALALSSAYQQSAASSPESLPDLSSGTSDEPITALLGQDAFVSCVAKKLQNYTVIWRFSNDAHAPGLANDTSGGPDELGSILTAGRQRVVADERFSVIQSHDTWLLKITNVKLQDTGTYVCQTNSAPPVRALRILSVVRPSGQPGQLAKQETEVERKQFEQIDYDFGECCKAEFVSSRCQRLCNFQQLSNRYQGINIVHECFSSLPTITRCMVGGRNMTDCCQQRHIPSTCNSMCGHSSDISSMSVQDQSYCADYSASIMSCVAEGISTLPGQPELVIVEAISSSQLKVSWQKVSDQEMLRKIDGWIINLTKLSSFEDTISTGRQQQVGASENGNSTAISPRVSSSFSISSSAPALPGSGPTSPLASLNIVDVMNNSSLAAMAKLLNASSASLSLKLAKQANEFTIDNLKPYTVYQIQMFAYNSKGRSQLTDPIRALTLTPEGESSSSDAAGDDSYVEPSLPDTRKCCLDRGVTLRRCLDTLCDPIEADRATIADLMICAPWSNTTFSCLSSRVNHTECCRARGVSPFCLGMCAGDIKRVDYRHFRCLAHMSTYTNCILESHDVLPSAPLNFTVGPITHTWAVLNWRPPKKHAKSLQGYRIYWRRVEPASAEPPTNRTGRQMGELLEDEFMYSSAEAATNPYLLDALQPETVYETFVVAVNKFGQSETSVRFVFQTLADPERLLAGNKQGDVESRLPLPANQPVYNETSCCAKGGVHSSCLQLCDYDIKVSDVSSLITGCSSQMPVIMRCMAGSRNSVPCCRNRGVSDHCLNVCAGLTEHSPLLIATRCASDFGNIIRCMDEGSKQIPSAPVDLHTTDIQPDRVAISWKPASEDALRSDIEYHVRYQQLQAPADQSSSSDSADLSALIAVVPLHPLDHNLILSTNRTEATLDKLKPNARYSLYVTAENSYGISLPSLVLVIQTPPSDQPVNQDQYKRRASLGAPHSLEVLRSDTESIVLKWLAPLYISSDSQVRYRVFYKLLTSTQPGGASSSAESAAPAGGEPSGAPAQQVAANWSVVETADTSLGLRNLKYSSQYVITVQAFSKQSLGHMSEILLASTSKPVPPTLNHPLVINQPIEGQNITIMCVALGQPTPQISMFINGLLVQKRTQPYVIYHLVNLARGHLTITCFASNGHGKDYASVQSRTEISVRFPAKAVAKTNQVRANLRATARLTCELTGNPQPTIVWTFAPQLSARPGTDNNNSAYGAPSVITPNDRITTLLVSQFENPFTWSHTLTLRNVSQADLGLYQCQARNLLDGNADSIQLHVIDPSQTPEPSAAPDAPTSGKLVEQNSDMLDCCRSQNVSSKCLPACTVDGLDVELAFKTPECQPELDKLMLCAADGSDHRNCCRNRQVPLSCLRWCSGARLNIPALCFLSSAVDINQCFQEGKSLLPGPPRNLRAQLASQSERAADKDQSELAGTSTMTMGPTMMSMFAGSAAGQPEINGSLGETAEPAAPAAPSAPAAPAETDTLQRNSEPIIIEWDPPSKNPELVLYYRVFWRQFGSRELSRTSTNLTWIKLDGLGQTKVYELVVKAANSHGSSVYSEPLKVKPDELLEQTSILGLPGFVIFGPSSGSASLLGRVVSAICFATLLMGGIFAAVIMLERRGYLKRFASSKSNSSRVSFANPAYSKDSDQNGREAENVTWDQNAHSLDVLGPSQGDVAGLEKGEPVTTGKLI